jgi:hypothetical protein
VPYCNKAPKTLDYVSPLIEGEHMSLTKNITDLTNKINKPFEDHLPVYNFNNITVRLNNCKDLIITFKLYRIRGRDGLFILQHKSLYYQAASKIGIPVQESSDSLPPELEKLGIKAANTVIDAINNETLASLPFKGLQYSTRAFGREYRVNRREDVLKHLTSWDDDGGRGSLRNVITKLAKLRLQIKDVLQMYDTTYLPYPVWEFDPLFSDLYYDIKRHNTESRDILTTPAEAARAGHDFPPLNSIEQPLMKCAQSYWLYSDLCLLLKRQTGNL